MACPTPVVPPPPSPLSRHHSHLHLIPTTTTLPSQIPPLTSTALQPPTPTPTDVVSWTSSIARSARRGLLADAAASFSLMLSSSSSSQPNHITYLTLLSACADFPSSPSSLPLGLSLHSLLLKLYHRLSDDLLLATALVDMYAKCRRPDLARQVFDRMPTKNSISYNTMIAGHMRNGQVEPAVLLFRSMNPSERDRISWTALIDGFVKNGLLDEALGHFRLMQRQNRHIDPDYVTLIALAAACADMGALGVGMWVHRYAMRRGPDFSTNVRLANSLIDMYSRCGRVDLAHEVFVGVDEDKRTRVTWNSLIVGFATNGCSREALDHFDAMQRMGVRPDGVSFTGALTACSHAGLVEEGMKNYRMMKRNEQRVAMREEHYGCIVDLLGRAGRLEEAMQVVESMAATMRPNEVVLGSLLAACRVHGNVGLAERLMDYLVELEPDTDSNYVLLSNIYAAVGRWDRAGRIRSKMKSLGIKKRPGFSSIEIDGGIHEFVAGDQRHLQSDSIYGMLDLLVFEMKLHCDYI